MLFAFDNVLDVITLSSYFTVSLSPGVAMWEVQRCDRMWGKSASADSLNQSINAYIPLQPGSQRHMFYLQVDFNSKNTVTAERQTFYCVPIPGENPWVKEISSCPDYVKPYLTEDLFKQGFIMCPLLHATHVWKYF